MFRPILRVGVSQAMGERNAEVDRLVSLPEGTCSNRAAHRFAAHLDEDPGHEIHADFMHAMDWMERCSDAGDILLLPHVNVSASIATLRPGYRLLDELVFPLENPPLYLARSKQPVADSVAGRCATISTLQPLVAGGSPNPEVRFVDAAHTQHAADLASSGEVEFCITNEAGLQSHEAIESVRQLKHFTVVWLPFRFERG